MDSGDGAGYGDFVNTFSKVGDFAAKLVKCQRCGGVTNGERRVTHTSFEGSILDWADTPGPHICISLELRGFLYVVPFIILVALVLATI